MLHLIARLLPPPLHRLGYRLAHWARKRWWRLSRARFAGCRVLAFDAEGRVLLVRHSYGSGGWMPPGGGLRRGEDPLAAAARELREETGCRLSGAWRLAVAEEAVHGGTNVVHIVAGSAAGTPAPDRREIVAAGFFAPDALPAPMPGRLRRSLPGWLTAARAGRPAPPARASSLPPAPTA
jgi:8-oxo-dGTP pyrophosphatase MutT (NUDIX family)